MRFSVLEILMVALYQRPEHGSLENHSDRTRWSFDLRYIVIGQKSGSEIFPGFVARSKADPEYQLRDADLWTEAWCRTRDQLATQGEIAFNERWKRFSSHKLCAGSKPHFPTQIRLLHALIGEQRLGIAR